MTSAAITFATFPQAPGAGLVDAVLDAVQGLFDSGEQKPLAPVSLCEAPEPVAPAAPEADDWKEICSRLLAVSDGAVSDLDLLSLLLSHLGAAVNARRLAKTLIARFGSFGGVIAARPAQVADAADVPQAVLEIFGLVRAAGNRLAREEVSERPVFDAWEKLIAYLRTTMAHQMVEQFRVLFLDRMNVLIADEVQHTGTIDHTPVYPREVAKRALELDASAIIMVHNHPSNHPAPSKADIEMTRIIEETMGNLNVVLHDHIIVSRRGHSSFRSMGLLGRRKAAA
jgi:DNA repair protein RadC